MATGLAPRLTLRFIAIGYLVALRDGAARA